MLNRVTDESPDEPEIVFADPVLERAYNELRLASAEGRKRLAQTIAAAREVLRDRHHEGRTLTGNDIPESYRTRCGLKSLLRLDIPPHWRVFYTHENGAITIIDLTCDGFI